NRSANGANADWSRLVSAGLGTPCRLAFDFAEIPTKVPAQVRTRIAKVLVVGALVCAIGGHWAVLQSVAWVGMFVKFSQSDPLMPALVKTFDGKPPCTLCLLIATGKKSEKKQ